MKRFELSRFVMSIIICFAAGIVGSFFTTSEISTWYAQLNKPAFNPPAWVFGPIWTTLYFLMGAALYLVWSKKPRNKVFKRYAYASFGVQLALNASWSLIFFGLHAIVPALVTIILMWLAVIVTIYYFFKLSRLAALSLLPYLVWVSFATVLNAYIAILN